MSLACQQPDPLTVLDPDALSLAAKLVVAPPIPADPADSPSKVLGDLLDLHRQTLADPSPAFPSIPLLEIGRELMGRAWMGHEREWLRQAADLWRKELVGDTVTYVVNRNLNASNHCVLRCGFCAFRRSPGEEGAFRLSRSELREKAAQAQALGATEVCLQAGLDLEAQGEGRHLDFASSLLADLKDAAPKLHLHGFSPRSCSSSPSKISFRFRRCCGPSNRQVWAPFLERQPRCSRPG